MPETRTASEIINSALREIGAFDETTPPTASESQNALRKLNSMLASWQNQRLLIPTFTEESFLTSPSANSYTIGVGGTFNTSRPDEITCAYIRNTDGSDFPLRIISRDEYNEITNKSATGGSRMLFYDRQYPLGLIKLYPMPLVTDTLFITAKKPFTKFASLTSTGIFPEEWLEAIEYNLAVRLNASFTGLPVNQDIKELAISAIIHLKSSGVEPRKMTYDGPGSRPGRHFNILAGL